jgi:hypothetical protein
MNEGDDYLNEQKSPQREICLEAERNPFHDYSGRQRTDEM